MVSCHCREFLSHWSLFKSPLHDPSVTHLSRDTSSIFHHKSVSDIRAAWQMNLGAHGHYHLGGDKLMSHINKSLLSRSEHDKQTIKKYDVNKYNIKQKRHKGQWQQKLISSWIYSSCIQAEGICSNIISLNRDESDKIKDLILWGWGGSVSDFNKHFDEALHSVLISSGQWPKPKDKSKRQLNKTRIKHFHVSKVYGKSTELRIKVHLFTYSIHVGLKGPSVIVPRLLYKTIR